MNGDLAKRAAKWKGDPVLLITEVLRDPETGKPFELYPAQVRFTALATKRTKLSEIWFTEGFDLSISRTRPPRHCSMS